MMSQNAISRDSFKVPTLSFKEVRLKKI